jgi:excisionase family DNA binding protein
MAHEPAPKLFYSMKEAAERLGVPLWKVRRAVKSGLLPTYTFYDTKKYLLLAEVEAVILRSREGGWGVASEGFCLHASPADPPRPAGADGGDGDE